jgi:hypothetical protein
LTHPTYCSSPFSRTSRTSVAVCSRWSKIIPMTATAPVEVLAPRPFSLLAPRWPQYFTAAGAPTCSPRPPRVTPPEPATHNFCVRFPLKAARAALAALHHGCGRADLLAAGPPRATRSRARVRIAPGVLPRLPPPTSGSECKQHKGSEQHTKDSSCTVHKHATRGHQAVPQGGCGGWGSGGSWRGWWWSPTWARW